MRNRIFLSNLCAVHFIHLFTTGAIVLIGSSKDIFLGFLLLEANVKIGIFTIPTAYLSGFGIFKQNRDGWTV